MNSYFQGNRGEISGGFTDVAFNAKAATTNRKGGYIQSERAFLFALSSPAPNFQIAKFDIVKKPYSICYHKDCGPIFGAGADLLIANACNANMDSYSNLPHSYDGANANYTSLFGDYNFTIQDYEVFTLGWDNQSLFIEIMFRILLCNKNLINRKFAVCAKPIIKI